MGNCCIFFKSTYCVCCFIVVSFVESHCIVESLHISVAIRRVRTVTCGFGSNVGNFYYSPKNALNKRHTLGTAMWSFNPHVFSRTRYKSPLNTNRWEKERKRLVRFFSRLEWLESYENSLKQYYFCTIKSSIVLFGTSLFLCESVKICSVNIKISQ